MSEPLSVRFDLIADEPIWEDRRSHTFRLAVAVANGRGTQAEALSLVELAAFVQQYLEALCETRLAYGLEGAGTHIPLFQTADDDRSRRQIDHAARAESRDELR